MKLEAIENGFVLYLKKFDMKGIDFDNLSEVEEYFRDILLRLKEYYCIDITGFYNINVYIDNLEGIVFRLEKEKIDYYSTFHHLEIRMVKEETIFLYEVDDIFDLPLKEVEIYVYKDNLYVKRKCNERVFLLYEFGKLIYENTSKIIDNGKRMTIF